MSITAFSWFCMSSTLLMTSWILSSMVATLALMSAMSDVRSSCCIWSLAILALLSRTSILTYWILCSRFASEVDELAADALEAAGCIGGCTGAAGG